MTGAAAAPRRPTAGDYLRLVKFSHSVFALPFALLAAWVAAGGRPAGRTLALVVVCAVAARTAAMAFNRLVDRDVDALNPRTRERELPTGKVSPARAGGLAALAGAVFVAGAFLLSPLCGWLAFPVLGVLLGYSFAKRFTFLAHAVLGVALGLAPLGAWLAVRGVVDASLVTPLLLSASVATWVTGFDLIYACQDAGFDAAHGLHSVPARFGVARALTAARWLHVVTVALWIAFASKAGLGWSFGVALALAMLLLLREHALVSPADLSKVDVAFFTLNGWVGVGLFVGGALDVTLVG